jgi:hypothetical protein
MNAWLLKQKEWQDKAEKIKKMIVACGFEVFCGRISSDTGCHTWVCKVPGYPKKFAEYLGGYGWATDREKIFIYKEYGKPSSKKAFYIHELTPELINQLANEHLKSCKKKIAQIRLWQASADFVEKDENKDDEPRPDNQMVQEQ